MENLKLAIEGYLQSTLFLNPYKLAITKQNIYYLECCAQSAFHEELGESRVELSVFGRQDLTIDIIQHDNAHIKPIVWEGEL